ncbi:MAG: c-type cytochrome domain-containing protein [Acidobacteriota bacterium]
MLATHCYECHSAEAPAPMGGLLVDTREGLLKGGSRGPAVVPGDPQSSRLIQALSYTGLDLRMPPSGKLEGRQIEDLVTWIRMGAPARAACSWPTGWPARKIL